MVYENSNLLFEKKLYNLKQVLVFRSIFSFILRFYFLYHIVLFQFCFFCFLLVSKSIALQCTNKKCIFNALRYTDYQRCHYKSRIK